MTPDHVTVKRKQHLQRLAWFLDNSIPIPFTRLKFGVESLIGWIPGIGDAIGGVMSTYILAQGVRVGASKITLARMVVNVALEVIIGFVPIVGDLFDMAWKANQRNVELLSDYLDKPVETTKVSWLWMMVFFTSLLFIGVASIWAGFKMLVWAGSAFVGLFGV